MTLGLVCDACSAFNPLGQDACGSCSASLGVQHGGAAPEPKSTTATHRQVEAPQAERPCPSCKAMVPGGHRFCGNCGKPMPDAAAEKPQHRAPPKTMFFSVMQAPGRAKLILIKGDGYDGVSYVLSATEHVAFVMKGGSVVRKD